MAQPAHSRTFPELVREQGERAPEALALVAPQGRYTYRDLAARAARVAGSLRSHGVRRGDRIGLLVGNAVEWIDVFLAAASVGAVPIPFSTWSTRSELGVLIEDAGLALLVASGRYGGRDFEADLRALAASRGMPAGDRVWVIGAAAGSGFRDYAASIADAEPLEALPPGEAASAGDVAMVLYTSGSTSAPKAVPLKHYAVLENAYNIGARQGLRAGDRVLLTSPLFWAFGIANALPATFMNGATLVLHEKFDAEAAMAAIERERCTAFYTLPAMTAAIARHPAYRKERLASLRTGVMIGSSEEFLFAVDSLGASELCNVYGATETCGNCCVTWHHWPLERRSRCQGPPLPGQELRFVDEDTGEVVAPGTPGLAEVRGYITSGYLGASAAQNDKAFSADGYYRTGDMGLLNADGDFVFVGRVSEMIKRAGINVSPAEVESVLLRHGSVHEAAVVGVPDAVRGERIFAFVVTKPGHGFDAAALLAHCATELSKYKLPDLIEAVTAFPLTVTGKLQRRELKRMAVERAQALAAAREGS